MTSASPRNSIFVASAAAFMALAPAAVLLFVTPTASAQESTRSAAVEVYLGDIPAGQAGASEVGARIKAAARSACADVATHSPLTPREQPECVRATVDEAMNKLSVQRNITILASND